jgi:hypothetical protein
MWKSMVTTSVLGMTGDLVAQVTRAPVSALPYAT